MTVRSTLTLENILLTLAGCKHLRLVCEDMYRLAVPDIEISRLVAIRTEQRYREDLGNCAYRILRVQHDGRAMAHVELTVINYGFWQLAAAWEMITVEERVLLDAAVAPTALRLLDRSTTARDTLRARCI